MEEGLIETFLTGCRLCYRWNKEGIWHIVYKDIYFLKYLYIYF